MRIKNNIKKTIKLALINKFNLLKTKKSFIASKNNTLSLIQLKSFSLKNKIIHTLRQDNTLLIEKNDTLEKENTRLRQTSVKSKKKLCNITIIGSKQFKLLKLRKSYRGWLRKLNLMRGDENRPEADLLLIDTEVALLHAKIKGTYSKAPKIKPSKNLQDFQTEMKGSESEILKNIE